MQSFVALVFVVLTHSCSSEGLPFRPQTSFFGVCRGGGTNDKAVASLEGEDYERAEQAILDAISRVEHKVQTAIEAEVDTLFHEHEGHKTDVATKAKAAVQQGVSTVKHTLDNHLERHVYPFENDQPFPYAQPKRSDDSHHRERRILHAVESAETAVLQAIQAEVDVLFHPCSTAMENQQHQRSNENDQVASKAAVQKVRSGVQNASSNVKDMQDHRREWLDQTAAMIQDYASHESFLE